MVLRAGSCITKFLCTNTSNLSFLVLIESLTKSQTFSPDWLELGLIRAKYGINMGEHGYKETR